VKEYLDVIGSSSSEHEEEGKNEKSLKRKKSFESFVSHKSESDGELES